jgi:uncharacterized protein YdhG (YjbR/CyaY superfamily)
VDKPTSVEEYLSWQTDEARAALEKLRDVIHEAAPNAEDGISYAMAGCRLHGKGLVCYAAFKDHYSFFPMSTKVIADHADELGERVTGKGTIRFEYGDRLPVGLVKRLVKARVAEVEATTKPRR